MHRQAMDRDYSEKNFTANAVKVHPKNLLNTAVPMRGGIRL